MSPPSFWLYREEMFGFIVFLLIIWVIISIVGFTVKGLLWLAIIGIILFVVTGIIGWVRRSASKK